MLALSPTFSDVGNWDRSVIQDILKEIAQTQQIDLNAKKRFKGTYKVIGIAAEVWAIQHKLKRMYRFLPPTDSRLLPSVLLQSAVVVINEADGLSRDAQSALRRTMESGFRSTGVFAVSDTALLKRSTFIQSTRITFDSSYAQTQQARSSVPFAVGASCSVLAPRRKRR